MRGWRERPRLVGRLQVTWFRRQSGMLNVGGSSRDVDALTRIYVHDDGIERVAWTHRPHRDRPRNGTVLDDDAIPRRSAQSEVPLTNTLAPPRPGRAGGTLRQRSLAAPPPDANQLPPSRSPARSSLVRRLEGSPEPRTMRAWPARFFSACTTRMACAAAVHPSASVSATCLGVCFAGTSPDGSTPPSRPRRKDGCTARAARSARRSCPECAERELGITLAGPAGRCGPAGPAGPGGPAGPCGPV